MESGLADRRTARVPSLRLVVRTLAGRHHWPVTTTGPDTGIKPLLAFMNRIATTLVVLVVTELWTARRLLRPAVA